jgi:membrane protein DedA with SNARE-associated domain
MALPTEILLTHGPLLLFVWVLAEQLGLPLPSIPVLVAAGALSAEGRMSFSMAMLVGLIATLSADGAWFITGRHYGRQALRLLCRLSLEPTTCVRRTQDSFGQHRAATLIFAKFAPGLATLAHRSVAWSDRCTRQAVPSMRCATKLAPDTAGHSCRPCPTTRPAPQSN